MNIVVLISGYGSNLKAIIQYIKSKCLPINIVAVISNNPNAYGLNIATEHNIPTFVIENHDTDNNYQDYSSRLLDSIAPLAPDFIILAGFMKILSSNFVKNYTNKIINIHPSLLPKYPGLHTHQKVLNNNEREHGCTIHMVTKDLDAGPIIAQEKFTLQPNETVKSLKEKVQAIEHRLYPQIIEQLLQKTLVKV